jgi:hypothetical protein
MLHMQAEVERKLMQMSLLSKENEQLKLKHQVRSEQRPNAYKPYLKTKQNKTNKTQQNKTTSGGLVTLQSKEMSS